MDDKAQTVIPGAEDISQRQLLQRKADAALKAPAPQQPLEHGLFGDAHKQKELF